MSWFLGSKKTSESGVWIPDEDAYNCYCCGTAFGVVIRKHHCRQCGQVVCDTCSSSRKYLESSRSGNAKRICDKCVGGTSAGPAHAAGGDSDDDEVEAAASSAAKASVSDAPAGAKGGAGSLASPSGGGGGGGTGEIARRPAPGMAMIRIEDATKALTKHKFEGCWEAMLTFHVVELGKGASSAPEADQLKAGSKLHILMDLETKGAAYFKGTVRDFGAFGKDGKVTGALQRAQGKVTMTISVMNSETKVTTTFNFQGMMNADGMYLGSFSGCEISKTAGAVSGIFKSRRNDALASSEEEEEEEEEEKPAAGKKGSKDATPKASDEESDDEDELVKKRREARPKRLTKFMPAKRGEAAAAAKAKAKESESEEEAPKKKAVAKKKAADDSEEDSEEERPKKKAVAAKKKAVESDDESEEEKPPKKPVSKKKVVESDDDDE